MRFLHILNFRMFMQYASGVVLRHSATSRRGRASHDGRRPGHARLIDRIRARLFDCFLRAFHSFRVFTRRSLAWPRVTINRARPSRLADTPLERHWRLLDATPDGAAGGECVTQDGAIIERRRRRCLGVRTAQDTVSTLQLEAPIRAFRSGIESLSQASAS